MRWEDDGSATHDSYAQRSTWTRNFVEDVTEEKAVVPARNWHPPPALQPAKSPLSLNSASSALGDFTAVDSIDLEGRKGEFVHKNPEEVQDIGEKATEVPAEQTAQIMEDLLFETRDIDTKGHAGPGRADPHQPAHKAPGQVRIA